MQTYPLNRVGYIDPSESDQKSGVRPQKQHRRRDRTPAISTVPSLAFGSIRTQTRIGESELLGALNSGDTDHADLVQWVDECLATGRDATAAERPSLRHIRNDGNAWRGLARASENLMMGLGDDGKPTLILDLLNEKRDFEKEITTLFLGFVLTNLLTRVAKCKVCGHYFLLLQANRVMPYKHGTLCETHKNARHKGTKAKSMSEAREAAKVALFTLAATQFATELRASRRWFEDADLRTRMIDYLNEQIDKSDELRAIYRAGSRNGITVKWLGYSTNRDAIMSAIPRPIRSRKR